MCAAFTRIDFPEIVLGFVAPVGAEINSALKHFRTQFERFGYAVVPIKVTSVFDELQRELYTKLDKPCPRVETQLAHQVIAAAMQTVERKISARLSYRVAMRRKSLSLQNMRSTRFRPR